MRAGAGVEAGDDAVGRRRRGSQRRKRHVFSADEFQCESRGWQQLGGAPVTRASKREPRQNEICVLAAGPVIVQLLFGSVPSNMYRSIVSARVCV